MVASDPHRGFAELYRRYYARVWRTLACLGIPESAVEDAVQDVFVVVHRRLGDPDQYRSLKSWIYAVTRRVAWHHRRGQQRADVRLAAVSREPQPVRESLDERVLTGEAATAMMSFLNTLDDDQRVVFLLAELEGLTAPEISEVVGAKVSTVYSRLRLARARFAQATERYQTRHRREAGRVQGN